MDRMPDGDSTIIRYNVEMIELAKFFTSIADTFRYFMIEQFQLDYFIFEQWHAMEWHTIPFDDGHLNSFHIAAFTKIICCQRIIFPNHLHTYMATRPLFSSKDYCYFIFDGAKRLKISTEPREWPIKNARKSW